MTAMFYSVSSRNAGLQINDMAEFNTTTILILAILMFIGASPSSVGGGVRTTTVGIFILYMFSFIRGHNNINVFNRRIGRDDVQKAIVVVGLSTILCVGAILILSITVLMFVGRIGMLYTLLFFIPKRNRDLSYELPTEKIIIG